MSEDISDNTLPGESKYLMESTSLENEYNLEQLPPGFNHEHLWTAVDPSYELKHPGDIPPIRYLINGNPNSFKSGGEANVYKAYDMHLNRYTAFKRKAHYSNTTLNTAIQEGRINAKLEHPHIQLVYQLVKSQTSPPVRMPYDREENEMISTQWIDGPSGLDLSKKAIETGEGLAPTLICKIATEIGSAISYTHAQGIIHCNITLPNILLRASDYHSFLVDFGGAVIDNNQNIYDDDTPRVGTTGFTDPEILMNPSLPFTITSDIYSFAICLYGLVGLKNPFFKYHENSKLSLDDIDQIILSNNPELLSNNPQLVAQLGPYTCLKLDEVFNRGLAKKRRDRYQTIDALVADFISALSTSIHPNTNLKYK